MTMRGGVQARLDFAREHVLGPSHFIPINALCGRERDHMTHRQHTITRLSWEKRSSPMALRQLVCASRPFSFDQQA